MSERTLMAVIIQWLDSKLNPTPPPPPQPIVPGFCECGHLRCCHGEGTGACAVGYPPDSKWLDGASCACKVYVYDPDENDDDGEDEPTTPSVDDLEKMYR